MFHGSNPIISWNKTDIGRLLDTNRQTDKQTDKPNLYIDIYIYISGWTKLAGFFLREPMGTLVETFVFFSYIVKLFDQKNALKGGCKGTMLRKHERGVKAET